MANPPVEETYHLEPAADKDAPHRFLRFTASAPDRSKVREIALRLANYYANREYSRNQWSRVRSTACTWEESVGDPPQWMARTSPPFHLRDIEQALAGGAFDPSQLGLPEPFCDWLDNSIGVEPNHHAIAKSHTHALSYRAEANIAGFPLSPQIDREGWLTTSFQSLLLKKICLLRNKLVDESVSIATSGWFEDFRTLASESISIIENTLHQVYFKAQYDPLPGWSFDPTKLGDRHGRRLQDKLRWPFFITGNPLHAATEMPALNRLRVVRNHMQHFDPPCFACTWEECAAWINDVLAIGTVLAKMREQVLAAPSLPLIELLLHRRVEFVPRHTGKRLPQTRQAGYYTSSEDALKNGYVPVATPGVITLRSQRRTRITT